MTTEMKTTFPAICFPALSALSNLKGFTKILGVQTTNVSRIDGRSGVMVTVHVDDLPEGTLRTAMANGWTAARSFGGMTKLTAVVGVKGGAS
jgi:hypothetical protein